MRIRFFVCGIRDINKFIQIRDNLFIVLAVAILLQITFSGVIGGFSLFWRRGLDHVRSDLIVVKRVFIRAGAVGLRVRSGGCVLREILG